MGRPDPALLTAARYPFSCQLEPRFGDLDINQHINNVAMAGLVEEARVRFHRASGMAQALDGVTVMVASLDIAFVGQTYYPEVLVAHVAPLRQGRTSYALGILVLQNSQPVAMAETVLVCIGEDGPVALPQGWAAAMAPWSLRA